MYNGLTIKHVTYGYKLMITCLFLDNEEYRQCWKVEQESRTKQAKCVQPKLAIVLNLLIETIWSPFVCEEWYWDSLSIAVKLQPTNSNCIHDRCIVDHLHFYPHFLGTNNQISMCSCPGNVIQMKNKEKLTKLNTTLKVSVFTLGLIPWLQSDFSARKTVNLYTLLITQRHRVWHDEQILSPSNIAQPTNCKTQRHL